MSASLAFDSWCTEQIRPWFEDHVAGDAALLRLWAGTPIDPDGPLTSEFIAVCSEADPSLLEHVGPYLAMEALPSSLRAAEAGARAVLASGWRPPVPPGPTRDDLVELVRSAAVSA